MRRKSFTDLDESWYTFIKSNDEERKQMCDDMIGIEGGVLGVFLIIGIIGLIVALCKGLI